MKTTKKLLILVIAVIFCTSCGMFGLSDSAWSEVFEKQNNMPQNSLDEKKKNPEMEEDVEIITLEFDEGEEVECEIMGVFDFNGKEYIALIPDDGTDDVYIYGYKEIGEEEFEIVDIEDDAEFEAVAAEFDKIMDEQE